MAPTFTPCFPRRAGEGKTADLVKPGNCRFRPKLSRLSAASRSWPVQQARLVGRIVIAFSQLEWALFLTPKRLRGNPLRLAEYRTWPKIKRVHTRCNQIQVESSLVLDGWLLEHVHTLITNIRDVNARRNKIIHGDMDATP